MARVAEDLANHGLPVTRLPSFSKWSAIVTPAIEAVCLNQVSVEEALATAEAEINNYMVDFPDQ